MIDFFHSWAFAFILGCFIGGAIGFLVAIILATGSRRSRAEERISDEAIHEAVKREKKRMGEFSSEDMTSRVEDILGRKVG